MFVYTELYAECMPIQNVYGIYFRMWNRIRNMFRYTVFHTQYISAYGYNSLALNAATHICHYLAGHQYLPSAIACIASLFMTTPATKQLQHKATEATVIRPMFFHRDFGSWVPHTPGLGADLILMCF